MALDRLAVFIDYQNCYKGARRGQRAVDGDDHTIGQVDPLKMGKLIAARHPSYPGAKLRKLETVRVYRGVPSNNHDPVGYAAARKEISRWLKHRPLLHTTTRTLAYRNGKASEKGIDVLLALDLAFGAAAKMFDVAVVFSGDADLLPALERAAGSKACCETAHWTGGDRRMKRTKNGPIVWEHPLTDSDYQQVHEPYDFR